MPIIAYMFKIISFIYLVNIVKEEHGRRYNTEVQKEESNHHLEAASNLFQRGMFGTAKCVFSWVVTQIKTELLILIFCTIVLIVGHVLVKVVLGCLKFNFLFLTLEKLYWRELVLIFELSFGSELQYFFNYFFVNAIILLVIDVPSKCNVEHWVSLRVLGIDISL